MIEVEEALRLIKSSEIKLKTIEVEINNSLGCVLAEDVISAMNMPPFKQSAMDGYSICGYANRFKVVGEIKAGDSNQYEIKEGEAYRIFTGAPVPENSTAVIMQEKAQIIDDIVSIGDDIKENKNIRPVGEQIKKGDVVFEKGDVINPSTIGLMSSLGIQKTKVYDKPQISLLVTGDELKQSCSELNFGEIYESNSSTLKSAFNQTDYNCSNISFVKDDLESTQNEIKKALEISDILVLSGGISVGDYDFVKQALEANGVQEVFYKVKQKPGKPLYFGKKGNKYVFALPGNPAAALTSFYIYILPLLNMFSGRYFQSLSKSKVKLKLPYIKKGTVAQFLRGKCTDEEVEILDGQASSMLWSFAKANCLIYIPSSIIELNENDEVLIYHLPQN